MALRTLCIDAIDGMASRRLRTLVSLSRAMALHAKLHLNEDSPMHAPHRQHKDEL